MIEGSGEDDLKVAVLYLLQHIESSGSLQFNVHEDDLGLLTVYAAPRRASSTGGRTGHGNLRTEFDKQMLQKVAVH